MENTSTSLSTRKRSVGVIMFLLLVGGLCFPISGIGVAEELSNGAITKNLQLSIEKAEDYPIYPNWPARVAFEMKSVSDEEINYYSLFTFIILEEAKGKVFEKLYQPATDADICFDPGRSYTYVADISEDFKLQPGQYTVTFACKIEGGNTVESNSINITVKELYGGFNPRIIWLLRYINPKRDSLDRRRQAVLDLAKIQDKSVISILRELLLDRDGWVSFNAARSLAELGDDSGIEILRRVKRMEIPLSSSGIEVRYAIEALKKLNKLNDKDLMP